MRSHASGYGGMLPRILFFFKNGAIRCNQGPILVFKTLLVFIFLNVAFADKSENKEKEDP